MSVPHNSLQNSDESPTLFALERSTSGSVAKKDAQSTYGTKKTGL